jgi:hypothetical protein
MASYAKLRKDSSTELIDRAHRPSSSTETAKDSSTELIDRCIASQQSENGSYKNRAHPKKKSKTG